MDVDVDDGFDNNVGVSSSSSYSSSLALSNNSYKRMVMKDALAVDLVS